MQLYLVETLDVSSPPNSSTFYSGPDNRVLTEKFALENNKLTLEMTPGGKWLDNEQLFGPSSKLTPDEGVNVWSRLSQRYAEQSSGTAVGFVEGARANSIFNTIEYPALQNNKNIVNVTTGGY